MTTINSAEDLIRIARDNEEFRDALRRELLTEELLALPQTVATLTDNVNALTKGIEEYKYSTDSLLSRVVERLDRQHELYRRQHDDLARFRGNYAIDAARAKDTVVAELFAQHRGMRRIQVRPLTKDDLDYMLSENIEAVEALRLRERSWLTFPKADIIAEVTERRKPSLAFYVVIEASYTADTEDVLRATDHAKILRCATGLDAYAVVAGVRTVPSIEGSVFDEAAQLTGANDEEAVLWFQLDEDVLEPQDPC